MLRFWAAVSLLLLLCQCAPERSAPPDYGDAGNVTCEDNGLTDSDGDGIPDEAEGLGAVDTDGDGTPDTRDLDSDEDSIPDEREFGGETCADPPTDTDGDGTPDFRDIDTDGNGIPDLLEGETDMDGDGLGEWKDTDDDGDRIPDEIEVGPDPADPADSDGDGLSDAQERQDRTDPCRKDTDEDGLTDLVEQYIGTDPTDASSAIAENEYMVILPYRDEPVDDRLDFTTNIKQADVYFLIDTTGSMSGILDEIQRGLSTLIVPDVASVVRDVQFGVGRFDDIPESPWGSPGTDVAYESVHEISGDVPSIQEAINGLNIHSGADGEESDVIALYCSATGEGVSRASVEPNIGCLEGRFGYPCFRPYSLPIILLFTDYAFHNGPPDGTTAAYGLPEVPDWLDAMTALNDIGAKVLGFDSGGYGGARDDLEATAIATGAVRSDDSPLVWTVNSSGAGLDDTVVQAIADLSSEVSRDVTTNLEESPYVNDGIDATDFITNVTPLRATPSAGFERMDETTFHGVEAGTVLTFSVTFHNDIVPHEDEPQVFVARIVVLGDNVVRLDDRRVIILIPPRDIPIG